MVTEAEAKAKASLTLLGMQPLKFIDWMDQLAEQFVKRAKMTQAEARSYVHEAGDCWHDYWADAYSPAEACQEDMSYWD